MCRVIDVDAPLLIEPADLAPVVGAERILLKTRNQRLWSDPTFRTDFVALSPAAAAWLIEQGVRLVGIDYLSVDPYDAEPAVVHLTLLAAGIVVLEGLDLRAVPPVGVRPGSVAAEARRRGRSAGPGDTGADQQTSRPADQQTSRPADQQTSRPADQFGVEEPLRSLFL